MRTRMASVDAVWLRLGEPTSLMEITAVLWFDGPVDRERLRAVLDERLVRAWPRFRQRVVTSKLPLVPPAWEDDPAFELDAHLTTETLPAPGDQAAFERLVSEVMGRPLETSRPLWCFHLVQGYGRGCALVARLHHCIADGISLARVLLSLADEGPEGGAPGALAPPGGGGEAPRTSLLQQGARLLGSLPRLSWQLLKGAAALGKWLGMSFDPRTPLKGRLGPEKRAAWSAPILLDEVKAIARTAGSTVNDVLLAAVTGALRRHLLERGTPARDLRTVVPVNVRAPERHRPMGNRFGLVFLRLPVGLEDARARLRALQRRMGRIKRSAEPALTFALLHLLGWAPAWLEKLLVNFFGRKATVVTTNVPGPRHDVYLAGTRLGGVLFWVPQPGRLGVGFSVFSYAGRVTVGVASDAGLVPEPHRLIAAFEEEFAALRRTV